VTPDDSGRVVLLAFGLAVLIVLLAFIRQLLG